MVLFNESNIIGELIIYMNQNVTGSLFLTLLFMVLVLLAICALFKIPMEFTALFILPLLLAIMTDVGEFLAVGGVCLIYLGILLAKNLWFK